MKKYELREKINILEMLGQEIARASDKGHPNALDCGLTEITSQDLQKASKQIEKACKLLEGVFSYVDFITK